MKKIIAAAVLMSTVAVGSVAFADDNGQAATPQVHHTMVHHSTAATPVHHSTPATPVKKEVKKPAKAASSTDTRTDNRAATPAS